MARHYIQRRFRLDWMPNYLLWKLHRYGQIASDSEERARSMAMSPLGLEKTTI